MGLLDLFYGADTEDHAIFHRNRAALDKRLISVGW